MPYSFHGRGMVLRPSQKGLNMSKSSSKAALLMGTAPAVIPAADAAVMGALDHARATFVSATRSEYGARREYGVSLNTYFAAVLPKDKVWLDIKFGDKTEAGQIVEAERVRCTDALKAIGHSNPAKAWKDARDAAAVALYGENTEGDEAEGEAKAGTPKGTPKARGKAEKIGALAAEWVALSDEAKNGNEKAAWAQIGAALVAWGYSSTENLLTAKKAELKAGKKV